MSIQPLQQCQVVARGVLEQIQADQMSASTPCASWDVSGLVNHMVGAQHFFGSAVAGEAPSSDDARDFSAGDYLAAFDQGCAAAAEAFGAEGVLEQMVAMPFGEMPGQAVMGLAMTDTFQHAWDLAKATGQSTDLAPEMAQALLQGAKSSISDGFRGPEGAPFGAEQSCSDGACAADQLAAFLGREV